MSSQTPWRPRNTEVFTGQLVPLTCRSDSPGHEGMKVLAMMDKWYMGKYYSCEAAVPESGCSPEATQRYCEEVHLQL